MDGTFFISDHLLPGAVEFLDLLTANKIPYYFLTNNCSKNTAFYHKKLSKLGLYVEKGNIFTSGEATAIYLKEQHPHARVFMTATPQLEEEFETHGIELVQEDAQIAVLGYDTGLTYSRLSTFCQHLLSGAKYIATHPDTNCPDEEGLIPDIGAIISFVQAATGRLPDVTIGKPYFPILSSLQAKTGIAPQDMAMVGDRLYTDIAMGKYGIMTILVLTGETKPADLEGSIFTPDLVVQDLPGLIQHLK